ADSENVVAAIASEDPVLARQIQYLRRPQAKAVRHWVRISLQAASQYFINRPAYGRRRRIRILVRIELDELPRLRLFAGGIAVHRENVGAEEGHRDRS